MKFINIILIGLLLAGCGPSAGQMTATVAIAKTQTQGAAFTLTANYTPSANLMSTSTQIPSGSRFPDGDPVLVGAGDIASCGSSGDEDTARLLDDISGIVFTTGDNAYPHGTKAEFANCYGPSWGRHKLRTYPSVGNHDYHTTEAEGYYDYFGSAAGDPAKGYYSYNLGAWHIVVLNSEIRVDAGSPQEQWLRADLAAHPVTCTAAYWHQPLFSSGVEHGNEISMRPLWQALYDYGADVVMAGHEHNYERFAPQDPNGIADSVRGIRQFVVGTGGGSHDGFGAPIANSEIRNSNTFGVLKLTLHAASYSWEFIPVMGESFTDSGNADCVQNEIPTPAPTVKPTPTLTFTPISDATVKADSPDDNYGSAKVLHTDGSPEEKFIIKFVVSGVNDRLVASAKLRLYNVNSSDQGGDFRWVVDNSWNERSLTWNTLPVPNPTILASLGRVITDTWYEVDLTALIMGDGTYSILVSSSSTNGGDYTSKEGVTSYIPQLILTFHEPVTLTP